MSRNFFTKKNDQPQPDTIHIKTRNLKRLKTLTAVALLAVIALFFTVMNLNRKTDEQATERSKLVAQINSLHKQLGQETQALDSVSNQQQTSDEKAMSYIGNIEQKLTKINDYLSKRGLHGFSFKHIAPTAKNKDKNNTAAIYSSYDNYLARLVNNVGYMPMGYPRISSFTSFFGYRGNPFDFGNSEFHPGIDFKGKTGDPVKCTANGTVEFTGPAGGYGNCIRIKHINNIETVYGHLSRINVRKGQSVSVGDVIGRVGSTGRSTGPHLHYEVRRNGKAVNPKEFLSLN
ncbi:MAG: peptidoglycan DD-metalloendopeptidase family protein [Bacteroidota bacterium]